MSRCRPNWDTRRCVICGEVVKRRDQQCTNGLTDEEIEIKGRSLYNKGLTYTEIARELNLSYDIVRRQLDPAWAEKKREESRRHRECLKNGNHSAGHIIGPITAAELEKRKALIPADTRDTTQRFFGDPIPNDPRRAAQTMKLASNLPIAKCEETLLEQLWSGALGKPKQGRGSES